jgi:N-acetylmuramoyl-L-alanine amidase
LGFPDRRVRQEPFNVIRDTLAPAVLLELGYLSNPDEEQALNEPTYPARAAEAIKNGIFDYFWQEIRPSLAN